MTQVERIEDWRGQNVLDADGESLGKLDDVYFDVARGEPLLVAVRSGLLVRTTRLAPLEGAIAGRDYLRLPYPKKTFEGAPEIAGPLDAEALDAIQSVYGIILPEQIELWTVGEMEAHRAAADEARRVADELERQAQAKIAQQDAARQQAKGAVTDADAAERAAEQAREAAMRARKESDRLSD
jgi:sporulation protein YlmC with PRC-barrel domain